MSTTVVEMLLRARDQMSGVLSRNSGKFKKWARSMRTGMLMVAAAAGSAIAALTTVANKMAALRNMADATGITTDALQGLVYGIEQAGGSSQNLAMALRTQAKFVGYLEQGLMTYTQYLGDLGIAYEDLAGKSPEETFHILAEALAGVDDEVRRTEIGMVMFGGRGMSAILAGMEQFDGSLRNAQSQFAELGASMSEAQINEGKAFSDFMTDIKFRLQSAAADGFGVLIPVVSELLDVLMDFAEDVMPSLLPALSSAIQIIAAIIPLLESLGPLFEAAGWTAGALADTLTAVIAAMTNYKAQQELVMESTRGFTETLVDAVALGVIPYEDALASLATEVDATRRVFGYLSDAHIEAIENWENLRALVGQELVDRFGTLAQTLREDVRAGTLSAAAAQEAYAIEVADSIPIIEEYAAAIPILGNRLLALTELHVTLADRVDATWSTIVGRTTGMWNQFQGWLTDYLGGSDDIGTSIDNTKQQVEGLMESLQGIAKGIDVHRMAEFSEEVKGLHDTVLSMDPGQVAEYLATLTEGQRELYSEYLEWLGEAREREMEAEEKRAGFRKLINEKTRATIEETKQANLAAIEAEAAAREASLARAYGMIQGLGTAMFGAMVQGEDAWAQWQARVGQMILDLVSTAAFNLLINLLSGGAMGGKGFMSLFGFQAGSGPDGVKPGGRKAQAGLTLPTHGPIGDNWMVAVGPGEHITKRDDVVRDRAMAVHRDLIARAGGGRSGSGVTLISRNPLLTEGELARVDYAVRRANA